MSTQTITVSLPEATIQEAEVIAARRHITIASLLAEALDSFIKRERDYLGARNRQIAQMNQFDLGLGSQPPASRESLHE